MIYYFKWVIYLHNYRFFPLPHHGSAVKNLPANGEDAGMQVQSPGQEDPLEEEMATHSNILAWEILWRGEPGRLYSVGLQRVRHVSTHTASA